MICRHCGREYANKDYKYCPYCGGRLENFFTTKEQDQFLIDHNNMLRKDLTNAFNEYFGTDKTCEAIRHRCSRLGLVLPKEVRYNLKSEKSHEIRDKLPIGTERIHKNAVYVKVADGNAHHSVSINRSPNWKRKSHVVWEQEHGAIPDGYDIIFADGNNRNFDIDNLICCEKKVAITVHNPMMFKSAHAETKKTAVKWSELFYAMKEVEK